MSSDLPRDGDLATNGDTNGISLDTPTVAPATAPATSTAPVSNHVENVMYSDVRLSHREGDSWLTYIDWNQHPLEPSQAKHCIFARTLNRYYHSLLLAPY